ncbi:hypothetical protein HAX54_035882 [Datura stramonium]|uniref:Uncharacterized protein n=1 Tax=Datura stramonium TaxID=4076 RepID=A0ABS8VFZ3_DATST|nr:hypothetical protein [Datura stramonium]
MTSRANKGRDASTSSKGFKRLKKGAATNSSIQRALPARVFGVQAVEEHGLKWFNTQKGTLEIHVLYRYGTRSHSYARSSASIRHEPLSQSCSPKCSPWALLYPWSSKIELES